MRKCSVVFSFCFAESEALSAALPHPILWAMGETSNAADQQQNNGKVPLFGFEEGVKPG